MALESGPITLPTSHSVAYCIATLTQLNLVCQEKMATHKNNLQAFKDAFKIHDLRDIAGRYSDPECLIAPLASSAHYYNLTIQGPMAILIFGTEELIKHFRSRDSGEVDNQLATIKQSTLLLAQVKLSADQHLQDFLKITPNIQLNSPSEKHKIALQNHIENISAGIRLLTALERLSIEYFEITLKAEDIFKQLNSYANDLQALSKQLRVTPLQIPSTSRKTETWDFPEATGTTLNSQALIEQLAGRLKLTSSDEDDEVDTSLWDLLDPRRTPSPSPSHLTQYQTQSLLPAAASQSTSTASSSPSEDDKQRLGFYN